MIIERDAHGCRVPVTAMDAVQPFDDVLELMTEELGGIRTCGDSDVRSYPRGELTIENVVQARGPEVSAGDLRRTSTDRLG